MAYFEQIFSHQSFHLDLCVLGTTLVLCWEILKTKICLLTSQLCRGAFCPICSQRARPRVAVRRRSPALAMAPS